MLWWYLSVGALSGVPSLVQLLYAAHNSEDKCSVLKNGAWLDPRGSSADRPVGIQLLVVRQSEIPRAAGDSRIDPVLCSGRE